MRISGGSREPAGFETLVAPHLDELYAYLARSAGNSEDGRDLLQETLIKAWEGYEDYREHGRARAWLFTIARRALIDWTRSRPPEVRTEPLTLERRADPGADPHERVVARDVEQAVLGALESVPEERRSVFLMRHHTPMTFREIAEILDIPLGTALSHMHHVTRTLRRALAPHAPGAGETDVAAEEDDD